MHIAMGENTTLSVKEQTLERFNEAKSTETGRVEPTADLFLNNLLDEWVGRGESPETQAEDVDEILQELENTQELIKQIPEDTQGLLIKHDGDREAAREAVKDGAREKANE